MAGQRDDTIVRVEDLRLDFHTFDGVSKVLVGADFEIHRGDVLGLVGETGCGKSVTASSIPRLVPCPPGEYTGGDVQFLGESVFAKSAEEMRELRARKIGMIFQDPTTYLNPVFSIERQMVDAGLCRLGHSNALTGGPLRGWRYSTRELRRQARQEAVSLLARVGFPDPERRIASYPHELSGGMRQRVLIAMSLIGNPDLLIADEPTTALDVSTQAQILGLIRSLVKEMHLTVLLITHNLGIVAQTCNRVAVMYSGRVIETGDIRQVFRAPSHPYTVGLLRAVPTMDTTRGSLEEIPGTIPNLLSPPTGCRFHPRCPYAMDVCRVDPPPPMRSIGDGTEIACHLYDGGAKPVFNLQPARQPDEIGTTHHD